MAVRLRGYVARCSLASKPADGRIHRAGIDRAGRSGPSPPQRVYRPVHLRSRDGTHPGAHLGLLWTRVPGPDRRRLPQRHHRPAADADGEGSRPGRFACCTTAALIAGCSCAAAAQAIPDRPSCAPITPGPFISTAGSRACRWRLAIEGTRMTQDNPDCSMRAAARVDSYRGFVFACLSADAPTLHEFLGEARIAFDDMCDRSPVGEVEIVPVCHRVMQHSNWKFFMENQLDALHPSVTHQSTGIAASRVERTLKARGVTPPLYYHYLSAFASSFDQWDSVQTSEPAARTRHSEGLHGAAAAGPGHAGVRGGDAPGLRRRAGRGAPGTQYSPRADLSVPVGSIAVAAAALPASDRAEPNLVRDLAFPSQGRVEGDLPPLALVLQPRQLTLDHGQRR